MREMANHAARYESHKKGAQMDEIIPLDFFMLL
jgi:hypothetical protein